MVGGIVIGLTRLEELTHVHVADCPHTPRHKRGKCPMPDTCCVYTVERREDGSPVAIAVGDSFWWQGDLCYWTPRGEGLQPLGGQGVHWDIKLRKVGHSH